MSRISWLISCVVPKGVPGRAWSRKKLHVAMSQMVMSEITSRLRIYRFKAGLLSKNDTRGDGA